MFRTNVPPGIPSQKYVHGSLQNISSLQNLLLLGKDLMDIPTTIPQTKERQDNI